MNVEKLLKRSRRGKIKGRLPYILLGICAAAVIISAVGLVRELYIARQGQSYYNSLTNEIETRPRRPAHSKPPATSTPASPESSAPMPGTSTEPGETPGEEPVIDEPLWEPYLDFEALAERFPGVVAWIQLEGTKLDYPVMQWTDNYHFLGHLPDGTRQRSGSVFLDYRNSADFSDVNTLIYGHESRTGDMFGILKSYRKQSFYEENPVIYIYTPERDFELVLVAGYLVDSGVETPPLSFRDDAAFDAHIASIKQRSLFQSDVWASASAGDRIVSLCTCAYDYPNARLVIVGKLVEF